MTVYLRNEEGDKNVPGIQFVETGISKFLENANRQQINEGTKELLTEALNPKSSSNIFVTGITKVDNNMYSKGTPYNVEFDVDMPDLGFRAKGNAVVEAGLPSRDLGIDVNKVEVRELKVNGFEPLNNKSNENSQSEAPKMRSMSRG